MPDQKPTLEYATPRQWAPFWIELANRWTKPDRLAALMWVLVAVVIILSMSYFIVGLFSN